NAGFHEPYNLWKDPEALKAYCFHWNMWAKRFRNASEKDISFDLLNEPAMIEDMNDQLSAKGRVPGDLYRNLIKSALEAIKKENNKRIVIADGNNIGNKSEEHTSELQSREKLVCRLLLEKKRTNI